MFKTLNIPVKSLPFIFIGITAAFSAFANFDKFLNFVGFFESLVDHWSAWSKWFWDYIFNIIGFRVELKAYEIDAITAQLMITISWISCSLLASIEKTDDNLNNYTISNAWRSIIIFSLSLLIPINVIIYNLNTYNMSKQSLMIFIVFSSTPIIIHLIVHLFSNNDPLFKVKFLRRVGFMGGVHLYGILSVFLLYLLAKVIHAAPPVPV